MQCKQRENSKVTVILLFMKLYSYMATNLPQCQIQTVPEKKVCIYQILREDLKMMIKL